MQSALADSIAAETALSEARSAVHAAAEAGKLHEHPLGMDRTMEREAARQSLECTHKVKEAEAVSPTSLHVDTEICPCHLGPKEILYLPGRSPGS